MSDNAVRLYLEQALHPAWVRLHAAELTEIEAGFIRWAEARDLAAGRSGAVLQHLVVYLIHYINQTLTDLG